ncbi:group II intron reverse transcriptase/maturase [Bacteroides sp. 51]|uniref:group II intron reverse transcriptase/maturase n=1 Tax=Bacteroides sp. 51 TaxID=2302938 RepID=UPI0013D19514|nr:group II intron reverse transcriptase/maturase [Bacteroides sp. 51]NDV84957.1 group II intron reverse transcriptase/maturase [Bacteroides sp. 51]
MNEIKTSCASTDHEQWDTWNSINWDKCQAAVNKLQARIVKAQKEGRHGRVKALQWTLTHSFYAKALAIKRITSNKGSNTAGVDRVLWSTPNAKFQAISKLKRRGYTPQPLRRIHIKKSNGKLRPLGIPTIKDRAMQALYLLALEPVAETTADGNSYGFRKERSTADARQQCFIDLAKDMSPEWILEGDIKGCFDHISHEWLLNNIPMDKVMLRKWLKCGFVFNKELFQTEEGTPQGGIISPTLANMTLDGLETILKEKYKRKNINGKVFYPKVNLVRYADDFIITGRSREVLEQEIKPLVEEFLQVRGLTLSEEKTKITHISEGFDFLGFNVRKYDNGKLLIKPSKEGLKKFMKKIRGIIDSNKGSKQESLIRLMNPVIVGWVNYYKYSVASDTFRKADYLIFEKLWQWARRRHPKKGKNWIADKYFTRIKNRNWCFVANFKKGAKDDRIALKRLYDTKITRYVKVKAESNPFDPEWDEYFKRRKEYKMLKNLNDKHTLLYLWKKQKGICPLCGEAIDMDDSWGTTERKSTQEKENHLVHDRCRRSNNQLKKM